MPIKAACPHCRTVFRADDRMAGRSARCKRCGASFAVPTSIAATSGLPQVIDRYEVRELLGAGTFGSVYRAYDPRLERDVALKVLKAEMTASPQAVERFLREAKAAAKLLHSHIVPVYDTGFFEGVYFIVSAFIKGWTLASAIPEGGLDPDWAARLAAQLASALGYAHQQGVLHRDVKPANAMLDEAWSLHLMDFGLAGWTQEQSNRLTRLGAVMGTPAYMAPEQAVGDTARMGPATDVYSAGVVLYELLTGRLPFDGGHPAALAYRIMNAEPPRPSQYRPGLDATLEAICMRAMAKHPARRFGSAEEMAAALSAWVPSAAPVAPPIAQPLRLDRADLPTVLPAAAPAATHAAAAAVGNQETVVNAASPFDWATQSVEPPQASRRRRRRRSGFQRARMAFAITIRRLARRIGWRSSTRQAPLVVAITAMLAPIICMVVALLCVLHQQPRSTEPEHPPSPPPLKHRKAVDQENPAPSVEPVQPPVAVNDPLQAIAPFDSAEAKRLQQAWADHLGVPVVREVDLGGGVTMKMVLIPPGRFQMGSADSEKGSDSDEKPQHQVTITKPFYLGMYPVTQEEYMRVTGKENPSGFAAGHGGGQAEPSLTNTANFPVERVSWDEAGAFCEALNQKDATRPATWKYELPTEAQWEYACRAGTTTAYFFGDDPKDFDDYAWYEDNSGKRTHEVGTRKANPWGLYDMSGNVWQWCRDSYSPYRDKDEKDPFNMAGDMRVLRGGSWYNNQWSCRSAERYRFVRGFHGDNFGCRVALRLE